MIPDYVAIDVVSFPFPDPRVSCDLNPNCVIITALYRVVGVGWNNVYQFNVLRCANHGAGRRRDSPATEEAADVNETNIIGRL